MTGFPDAGTLLLRHAGLPHVALEHPLPGEDAVVQADLLIVEGVIAGIGHNLAVPGGAVVHDCRDGLALPAIADIHTHLDKGHIWPRRHNPDGTFMGALLAVELDREANWSAADIERRMDFALRCAFAHGTAAIRTHLDSAPPQNEVTWAVFDQMRARWADRIELQAVALVGPDIMLDLPTYRRVAARAAASGGHLGGAIAVWPDARRAVYNAVELAGELGLDLDLHVDETLEIESSALRHLADAVIETGFKGKVLAGHSCVLSVQDAATAAATIERVAEAGIAVVALPMCNMYLQHRRNDPAPLTPRYSGVTLVNELRAAGVPVALASDNTRDPFYAYGDLDGIEVFREAARIAHFDHPQAAAWNWLGAVTSGAAAIAGFGYDGRLAVGAPADLLLFGARNWTELMSRPQSDRVVLRAGRPIDTRLPDYRELDDLMG